MDANDNKVSFREIRAPLRKLFQEGKNAYEAWREINKIHGPGSISKATTYRWFAKFRSGDLNIVDAPRSGRPQFCKVDSIFHIVEEDNTASSHEIASELDVHHQTVLTHLKRAGYKKIEGVWVLEEHLDETFEESIDLFSDPKKNVEVQGNNERQTVDDSIG